MNKSAIQKFAIQARRDLIEQVKQRAYQYGIDETGFGDVNAVAVNGRVLSSAEKLQRQELIRQIQQKGYTQGMEEVAYTWFNRFIALRFMEVNNYLSSHIRVFSDASGSFSPEILKDALHLDLPGLDKGRVAEYIESNNTDDLYRYLLLTQCNALNEALPVMFQRMSNYTEMLLPNNILRPDSVLGHMVTDIPEEDWQDQVQIIGWMYQYYNTEPKQAVFDGLKKNIKITKDTIPAATQLFTPDWIVRYMVENSLGRLWTEGHPNAELKAGWKYYLDEAEQKPEVEAQLAKIRKEYQTIKPEEIKVIDPCMGSGHILAYAFDVLMQIYQSAGWDQREAAQSILEHNLYGLDIDDRATQLAYFAVMMKARQYDRRIFTRDIQPHVYAICESNGLSDDMVDYFVGGDTKLKKNMVSLITEMCDAKEYGSILNITPVDFDAIYSRFDTLYDEISMYNQPLYNDLLPFVRVAQTLAQKYSVVVTNPPYMGSNGMDVKLTSYVKKAFPNTKQDLFACFIERCMIMTKNNGFFSMITQHAWMFLASFEKLRHIILKLQICNMAHLGTRAFDEIGGEVVQTTSFVTRKTCGTSFCGTYVRLTDEINEQEKERSFCSGSNKYSISQSNFEKIPGAQLAYWIGNEGFSLFGKDTIGSHSRACYGFITGDNNKYMRLWFEIKLQSLGMSTSDLKTFEIAHYDYVPCNKGGNFRKWYGNNDWVVNWRKSTLFHRMGSTYQDAFFQPGLTWSVLSSNQFNCRYYPAGFVFDHAAASLFVEGTTEQKYILGFMNSRVFDVLLNALNPTINSGAEVVMKIPLIYSDKDSVEIDKLVDENIDLAKEDWDSFETSWDFKRHPLI